MRLHELLCGFTEVMPPDREVTGLTDDSRKISEGCVFVCIKGERFDGHDFAAEAIAKGAACVVTEQSLGLERELTVLSTRDFYGILCARWFGNPQDKMAFVGVTGTNGKTTMTSVIKRILEYNHECVGLIGTTCHYAGDEPIHSDNTTPPTFELFRLLAYMLEKGCTYVVMEASSFGLCQKRIGPIHFKAAVFTNLTPEHLDYHDGMEEYYQAKKLLFNVCDIAFCNADDEYGERLLNEITCEKYSFSCNPGADFYSDAVKCTSSGSSFWFCCDGKSYHTSIRMPGRYNISNTVAAMATCLRLGVPIGVILAAIREYPGVRGRCELIPTGRDFSVICDYAHTPDALDNMLSAVRHFTKGRLICLFGCGGNRDSTKRPLMAAAAAKYSDLLVITSDNPRNESPDEIIDDIMKGLPEGYTAFERVTDRKEAIFRALKIARKDDTIVLAGKGHEDYQILAGGVKIDFDERIIVEEGLKRL